MVKDCLVGWHGWGLGLVAAILVGGCGSSDGLVDIGGTVTFDGQPISEGRIQFRMTEGDKQAYAGMIEDGKYMVRVAPGAAAVEIRASRPVPGKFDESNPGEPEQIGEMYIPEKYNSRTELKVTVASPKEDQNFDLTAN